MALNNLFVDITSYLDLVPVILARKTDVKRTTLDKESYSWNDGSITLEIKKYQDILQGTLVFKCSNRSQRVYQGCFSDDLQL